jgi:hypothetical protein
MQPLLSVFRKNPLAASAIAAFPVAALVAVAILLRQESLRRDFGFLTAVLMFFAAAATTAVAIRGFSYAIWLGMPVVAMLALRLIVAFQIKRLVPRLAIALVLTPMALSAAAISINTIAVNDILSDSEAGAGFTISGTTEHVANGTTVTVTLNSITYNATVSGASGAHLTGGVWSVIISAADASGLANGLHTVTATADSDDANPNQDQSASRTFSVVDIEPPRRAPEAAGGAQAASPPLLRRTKRLVLEPEKSGELSVLPLAVYFHREGEAKESSFLTEEVKIEVKGIEDIGALALRGPRGIYAAPPASRGVGFLPWIAGGAAVLLAAAALAWRVARRPGAAPPPALPHEIAYESLRRLVALDLIEKGEVERFFVLLSAILRQYIENRFRVRAPERTTEEFLAEASANRALEGHSARLGEFLALSDKVKFARFHPEAADIQSAFDVVKQFVAETILEQNR